MAGMARRDAHQLFEHPPEDAAFGIAPAVGEQGTQPLELCLRAPLGPASLPRKRDFVDAGAAEPDLFLEGREILPRRIEERARREFFLRLRMRGHAGE